jgi:hypothetical protein
MEQHHLELYWSEIPTGKENAVDYPTLCAKWRKRERTVREILHDLSLYDNGDDFVLIRSGQTKGFYKTDDKEEIAAFRRECLNKGRSVFAPVRKCNRILRADAEALQTSVFNNLKAVRVSLGMTQPEVVKQMKARDCHFDVPMLSKMESGAFLPTPYQLAALAQIYAVEPCDLVMVEETALGVYSAI